MILGRRTEARLVARAVLGLGLILEAVAFPSGEVAAAHAAPHPTASPRHAVVKPHRKPPPPLPARKLIEQAMGNDNVTYVGTRTSIFWSERGKTRAVVARIYKDGNRTRYDFAASGSQPSQSVIETEHDVYFVGPREVTVARRQSDPDVDGFRIDLALRNYQWRYESPLASVNAKTKAPRNSNAARRHRVVAAYRPGSSRPEQRFWVLADRKMIFRSERYGPQGELRASWSISPEFVDEIPEETFHPPKSPTQEVRELEFPERVATESVQGRVGFRPMPLPERSLPAGFQLVDVFLEQSQGSKAVRYVYSDGLENLTLLEAPKPRGRLELTSSHRVSILDRTAQVVSTPEANLVHWHDNQRLYTLIGAQPEAELLRISHALIASGPRAQPSPAAPQPPAQPPRRTFGEAIVRGWNRLLRIFGGGK